VDEYTKLSGPSAFRDTLNFLVKKVIKNSKSFEGLSKSFTKFNEKFKSDVSKDGISIQNFQTQQRLIIPRRNQNIIRNRRNQEKKE